MKVRFKKVQLVTMGAMVGILLLNPASVEVLESYFKLVYTGLFLISSVWVVLFLLWAAFKPEKVKLPTKSKKTTKGAMAYEEI